MESAKSRDGMEEIRLVGGEDLIGGIKQAEVARKCGVSRATASRWAKKVKDGGPQALRKRKATGRPPRMDASQVALFKEIWDKGPRYYGLPGGRWIMASLAKIVEQELGLKYDRDHIGKLTVKHGLREKRLQRSRQSQPPSADVPMPVTESDAGITA